MKRKDSLVPALRSPLRPGRASPRFWRLYLCVGGALFLLDWAIAVASLRWESPFNHIFTVINFPLSLPFKYLEQQRNPWWRDIFGYHPVSQWVLNDEIGVLIAFLVMVSLQAALFSFLILRFERARG